MTPKELVKVNNNTENSEYLEDVEYFREKLTEIFDKILYAIPNAWKKPYSWEDKKGE